MKHLLHGLFLIAAFLCCNFEAAFAQQMQFPPLPVDKNVRIGKLDNGLTYYIRHNALPEKRVDFYIAQKVGAILEEPQQRGLAHFLEHMAFNGTKNFPGNEKGLGVVAWCETKGIKFGTNLNAYTGIERTVYNVSNVPTDKVNVVDSCLLILHDWSNAILLSDTEIDKERGVIREEWRSSNSGMRRIIKNVLPKLYPDSKYADCMPIGNIDVINNFPYKDIRDYYAKWYRPDLQGIIIVGDINVDEMEAKVKKVFSTIKAPINPAKRTYFTIGDNTDPIVTIGTDKEMQSTSISVFFKHEATPDSMKNNIGYYASSYMFSMVSSMLNSRLNEIREKANPPFTSAYSDHGDYFISNAKEAFSVNANCKSDGIETALKTILEETERARRFGFTASEYERAKANYMQVLETAYNERNKSKSEAYAGEYIENFLDNEPIPGIEYEYTIMNKIIPSIPVEVINQVVKQLVSETNQVVLIAGPEKEGIKYPTEQSVVDLLKQMKSFDLKAYEDKVSNEPLISEKLKGGKIVSEKAGEIYGTTKLTLSNGVTVYIKKTDYKADEILMRGVSLGGSSLFPDKDAINIAQLNKVALIGGIGNFNKVNLSKALAGKKASVAANISDEIESVNGNCSPKDFETMMQLTYLTFTAPRKDNEAFESYKNRLKAELQNADMNPMSAFSDSISATLFGKHPRLIYMKQNMVDQINYDRILEMYKDRFKNAGDFSFYFIGNIDLEKVKPLIAQYLGSLPAIKRNETFKDNKLYVRKGNIKNEFARKQETPMATILYVLDGSAKYNLKNTILASFLQQALDMVYTTEIREKEGGTYGVSCYASLAKFPKEEIIAQIVFQTDPAKKDKLLSIVVRELDKMAKEGPSAEHMQKIKEYMLKKFVDNQKENGYWLSNINEFFYTGLDKTKDYEALVNSVTSKDVQQFLSQLMQQKNQIQLIMTVPEGDKK